MTSGGVRRVTLIEKKNVVDTMDQSIEVARPMPLTKAATKKELPPLPSVPPKRVIKIQWGNFVDTVELSMIKLKHIGGRLHRVELVMQQRCDCGYWESQVGRVKYQIY